MRESFVAYAAGEPGIHDTPEGKIGANPTLDRRTNMVSGPALGETQRPWGAERSPGGVSGIAGRLIISEEVEDETKFV
jgi:hypothetical protein